METHTHIHPPTHKKENKNETKKTRRSSALNKTRWQKSPPPPEGFPRQKRDFFRRCSSDSGGGGAAFYTRSQGDGRFSADKAAANVPFDAPVVINISRSPAYYPLPSMAAEAAALPSRTRINANYFSADVRPPKRQISEDEKIHLPQ